jgi:hypothetical protein
MTKTPPTAPSPARDHGLDDTLRETFPASDPLSTIPDPEPGDDAPPPRPPPPQVPARRWTDKLGEQHRAELDAY